jgi:hypothetical protein
VGWLPVGGALGIVTGRSGALEISLVIGTTLCFAVVEFFIEKFWRIKFISDIREEKMGSCGLSIFDKISSAFEKINSS